MPEGDTVHLAARRLNEALSGRILVRTDFRVPSIATADLSGQTIREVVARGKHLMFRTDAGVTLHTHFEMEGSWHLYRHGERWRGPAHEVRVVLETAEHRAVGFRLPVVDLLPTTEEPRVVGHLGPDVLGPDWDPDEALRRLSADPGRTVGELLLDQRVMAGPGNVYRSEVCFLRGIHPSTRIGEVRDPAGVVRLTKRLMEANRGTGQQVTTGDTRRGRERWVYGRAGEPCRRCGSTIVREYDPNGRPVFWCPACQPPV